MWKFRSHPETKAENFREEFVIPGMSLQQAPDHRHPRKRRTQDWPTGNNCGTDKLNMESQANCGRVESVVGQRACMAASSPSLNSRSVSNKSADGYRPGISNCPATKIRLGALRRVGAL